MNGTQKILAMILLCVLIVLGLILKRKWNDLHRQRWSPSRLPKFVIQQTGSPYQGKEIWKVLEDIDLRDLKLYRYYSALSGKEDITRVIDLYLERVYNLQSLAL